MAIKQTLHPFTHVWMKIYPLSRGYDLTVIYIQYQHPNPDLYEKSIIFNPLSLARFLCTYAL